MLLKGPVGFRFFGRKGYSYHDIEIRAAECSLISCGTVPTR